MRELGVTRRELEILELIAIGISNREIAEKLFVSENTVKTHSSRLYLALAS
ncbi:MAG TPA: LuxR C-terminal-related transcriptional regulator [Pyrinomonadaceae bacterium]